MQDTQDNTINEDLLAELEEAVAEEEQEVAPPKKRKSRKNAKKAEDGDGEDAEPKKRKRRYSDEEALEMYRLAVSGVKRSEIAEQFGCSTVFIYNMVKGNVYADLDDQRREIDNEVLEAEAAAAAAEAAADESEAEDES